MFFNDVPKGHLTKFEGLVLCYGPDGDVIWHSRFPSLYNPGYYSEDFEKVLVAKPFAKNLVSPLKASFP